MPNKKMFSNKAALKKAVASASWKITTTLESISNNPEYISRFEETTFDQRDLNALIPLVVDMSSVENASEKEQKEYFVSQAKVIADAFAKTRGPDPRMPDPKAVEPYLRKLYSVLKTDFDLDWDNEKQIENLLCSAVAQQSIAVLIHKFANNFYDIFPTKEEQQKIDSLGIKSYVSAGDLQNLLTEENPEYVVALQQKPTNTATCGFNLRNEVAAAYAKATDDGSNTVMIDPTVSNVAKLHFLRKNFVVDDTAMLKGGDYTSDEAARDYLEAFTEISTKTMFESLVTEGSGYKKNDLLTINGKPISKLITETMEAKKINDYTARIHVGKMLRNAMTDGKSIVSLMRPVISKNGKMHITHQDVKVDLDKLNEIDRKQKYGWFRRMLDVVGIWKIPPKFASNEERDKIQNATKETKEFQEARSVAEQNFMNSYNERAIKQDSIVYKSFPKVTLSGNENTKEIDKSNTITENNESRQPFPIDKDEIDNTKTIIAEPITKTNNEKVISQEAKTNSNLAK